MVTVVFINNNELFNEFCSERERVALHIARSYLFNYCICGMRMQVIRNKNLQLLPSLRHLSGMIYTLFYMISHLHQFWTSEEKSWPVLLREMADGRQG